MFRLKSSFYLLMIYFLFNFSLNSFSSEIKIPKKYMGLLLMMVGMMK